MFDFVFILGQSLGVDVPVAFVSELPAAEASEGRKSVSFPYVALWALSIEHDKLSFDIEK